MQSLVVQSLVDNLKVSSVSIYGPNKFAWVHTKIAVIWDNKVFGRCWILGAVKVWIITAHRKYSR